MYEYKAKILSVYDGDGVYDAQVDMGMNLFQRKDIRLYGVDTPEMRGEQREAGIVVRDFVRELILNEDVVIHTYHDKTGKYGRLLADIHIISDDGLDYKDLSDILLEKGYAKVYTGGKKLEWDDTEIDKIIFGEVQ